MNPGEPRRSPGAPLLREWPGGRSPDLLEKACFNLKLRHHGDFRGGKRLQLAVGIIKTHNKGQLYFAGFAGEEEKMWTMVPILICGPMLAHYCVYPSP